MGRGVSPAIGGDRGRVTMRIGVWYAPHDYPVEKTTSTWLLSSRGRWPQASFDPKFRISRNPSWGDRLSLAVSAEALHDRENQSAAADAFHTISGLQNDCNWKNNLVYSSGLPHIKARHTSRPCATSTFLILVKAYVREIIQMV